MQKRYANTIRFYALCAFAVTPAIACDGNGGDSSDSDSQSNGGAGAIAFADASAQNSVDGARDAGAGNEVETTGGSSSDDEYAAGVADRYTGLTRKPERDASPVDDCAGERDMTLCNLATDPDRGYDICFEATCISPGCGDESCNVPGPHVAVPPILGHRFFERDAGDEPLVVDLITGLHWQGCVAGLRGNDCASGQAQELLWGDAVVYCDALNWAGHDDWYLPDPYEWITLYTADDSGVNDTALFPNGQVATWTNASTDYGEPLGEAIAINGGLLDSGVFADEPRAARCVRRGFSEPMPINRITRWSPAEDAPDEFIIRDAATGLDWQACDDCRRDGSPEELAYADAVAYCKSLNWAGYDDWRLPTVKEHLTTQSFYESTGVGWVRGFKRYTPYLQAYWGESDSVRFGSLYTNDGSLTGPNPDNPQYPTVCVRWTD